MGLREFWAWVEQLHHEKEEQSTSADSWQNAENDPGWQAMRAKRDKLRGR